MQLIKLFKSTETEIAALEATVNQWLTASEVQVVSITGNIAPQSRAVEGASVGLTKSQFAPSDVLLIVLYKPKDTR